IVFDVDLFEDGNETDFADRLFLLLHVFVTASGTFMVVEGDAGGDDIEHDRSPVRDGRLEHGEQLLLVAGEGPADKSGAELNGERAGIDGGQVVDDAGFE